MSNMVAILVHGFNVTYPERTVNKLRGPFEDLGTLVETFNYGHTNLLQVRWRNPKLANRLAVRVMYWKLLGYKVIVAGHSNGATIAHLMANRYPSLVVDGLLAVNPALPKKSHPCIVAKISHIWYNEGDMPTMWARWLSKIIPESWFQARPWGEMGRVGYTGDCCNVRNFDAGRDFDLVAQGHSDVFHGRKAKYFLPLMAKLMVLDLQRYCNGQDL